MSLRFNGAANNKLEEFAHGAMNYFEVWKIAQNCPILEDFELEKITVCASPTPLSGLHIQNNDYEFIYQSFFINENAYIYCKYQFRRWNMFSSDDDEISDFENMFPSEHDSDDISSDF